ncbi:hypothetical protein E2C01_048355 [Portunus trituberculatus]|uniref:Uncharacterized protein n=1 Tax=Portunus trituberculatus TaxID=210409 RepID=A0A5B7GA02_PORTR|nr:hypothetical protein [Portunus trituberculatus]
MQHASTRPRQAAPEPSYADHTPLRDGVRAHRCGCRTDWNSSILQPHESTVFPRINTSRLKLCSDVLANVGEVRRPAGTQNIEQKHGGQSCGGFQGPAREARCSAVRPEGAAASRAGEREMRTVLPNQHFLRHSLRC